MKNSMNELESLIQNYYNEKLKIEKKSDLQLYQYTDITSLHGIVKNDELWATHFRYLNDRKELDYGLEIAVKYAKDDKKNHSDVNTLNVLDEISKIYEFAQSKEELPLNSTDVYSISFSTKKDLLSQWRGYGKKYRSICIGMDSSKLIEAMDASDWFVFLRKVVYDPDIQETLIKEYMENVCKIIESNSSDFDGDDKYMDLFKYRVKTGLILFALCFKEKCWDEENEWRIMAVYYSEEAKNPQEIFFKENNYGLVPYIKLPCTFDAIKEVVIPKTDNFVHSKKALELFFNQKNKDHSVQIEQSKISIVYQ